MSITRRSRVSENLAVSQAEARERAEQDASKLHPAATRSERETNRLMAILNELKIEEEAP